MWLLSTAGGELREFVGPENVPGGYAILSHVWTDSEQTFTDLQRLSEACAAHDGKDPKSSPRERTSEKIGKFCILAESWGYDWVWVDTCCIDKSSSSQLSEAINSMYRYYALAGMCFAYLADVPTGNPLEDASPSAGAFRESKWHTRGWTLQELIAPDVVVFLSAEWECLGTKADLAQLLQDVTRIPKAVFVLEEQIEDYSIAQRMSWAALRQTTRLEDEAYCLMGLFGINMPTLYGEGRKAFRRLQEEIMKKSVDTSLFAWGWRSHIISERRGSRVQITPGPGPSVSQSPPSLRSTLSSSSSEVRCTRHGERSSYLLAHSPWDFIDCDAIRFTPRCFNGVKSGLLDAFTRNKDKKLDGILPTFTVTAYGVSTRVPIIQCDDGRAIALLFCSAVDRRGKHLIIGLLLQRCPDVADITRPLYHVFYSDHGRLTYVNHPYRQSGGKPGVWTELYITHDPPSTTGSRLHFLTTTLNSPFYVPRWDHLRVDGIAEVISPALDAPWYGHPAASFVFRRSARGALPQTPSNALFVVTIGICKVSRQHGGCYGAHWANVSPPADDDCHSSESTIVSDTSADHDCRADHIHDWPFYTRTFEILFRDDQFYIGGNRGIELSFTRIRSVPEGETLKMRVSVNNI